jgi:NTE family protein
MAQASAICKNNFDSLFVPLRVVASDIFTQNEVILSKGNLSDALRATQTVPFFYNPIRVDGKYLFDGGVYNNFPVDIAQRDFKPDILIGVNVSTKIFEEYPFDNDDKLIARSLLFLLLDKSDPSMIPDAGVFIQPNLKGFTSFDFARAKSLVDSGYAQTMRQMDEIKKKINSNVSCDSIVARRNAFNSRNIPIEFGKMSFQGFNAKQRGYIRSVFKTNRNVNQPMTHSQIKRGYFRLVSEEYFTNIYPRIIYDTTNRFFRLQLTRRPQQNFQVDFGGVIATRDISNIFLGINYYWFQRTLSHAYLGFQTGNFYKSALGKVRFDLPTPFYVEPYIGFDSWDYLENNDILQDVTSSKSPTVLKRINRKIGFNAGVPLKHSFKVSGTFEAFNNSDRYINGNIFISTDTLDELHINGFRAALQVSTNTLNRRQYASAGKAFTLTASFYNTTATLTPGNTSITTDKQRLDQEWLRLKFTAEQYINSGWYKPGYYVEGVFSNQPSLQNYVGTIINTPAFFPLQDSKTLLLQKFRSFNYLAGGIRNVFTLRHRLDARLEAYIFKPFDYLSEDQNQETTISNDIRKAFLAGSASLVYHGPIGPISLSVNYYDDKENQVGVLMHVGFLLFQRHSLE